MAPKKAAGAKQAKAAEQAKKKVVEDKTFGLKNKSKSAVVKKYVAQVKQNIEHTQTKKKAEDPQAAHKAKKAAEEAKQRELKELFVATIRQPKVPAGVDPKSIVCEFYRNGACTKGFKCKFSHDLTVERKGPKIDIYSDRRGEDAGEGEDEGMEDWDQDKLESVVKQKHGAEKKANETQIICKFFLDAVEKRQYGWFWQCPNGKVCKYRHALPPGYVLKSQMKELLAEEARNVKDVAEEIEEERAKVDAKTPITEEVFRKWHSQLAAERLRGLQELAEERRRKGVLTGREIFESEGFVATDDASATDTYEREIDDEEQLRRAREAANAAEAAAIAAAAAERAGASSAGGTAAAPAAGGSGVRPPDAAAGSSSNGGTLAGLSVAEAEELFDDDDDDEELDDDELAELEGELAQASVS